MNTKTIHQNKLAHGLASPQYCLLLHQLGCTQRTAFVWLEKNGEHIPFTYEFDPDHYYEQGDKGIIEVAGYTVIPAYSIAELKRVLCQFNYTLAKENAIYQLQVNGRLADAELNSHVFNEREEDAFAAIIMSFITNKLLSVDDINEQIRHD